ncbi:MAG: hypothetical protein LBB75_08730 [Oscillospiraceae bacterium]|jgi:hypothetical protein|nr:hypothetical protein [Oscillospiraceae bacterium]
MGNSTALAKKQKFLAGVACSLIVLEALNKVTHLNAWKFRSFPVSMPFSVTDLVSIIALLLEVLVLLKFLLPGWKPHKMWLGCVLGASLATEVAAEIWKTIQSMPDLRETVSKMMDAQLGDTVAMLPPGFMDTAIQFVIVFAGVAVILVNPYFYLLLGVAIKKGMEKTAGVFSAIKLGFLALAMVFVFATSIVRFNGSNDLPYLLVPLGYAILYFNWPVLSRPILEKENPFI